MQLLGLFGRQRCLFACASILLVSFGEAATLGKYDPCTPLGLATTSQGFYVGVAFWPGYTTDDWGPFYNTSSGRYGLNPCNTTADAEGVSDRAYLAARGVVLAGFELKVDLVTAMKFSYTDLDSLYNVSMDATTKQAVVSMVVFRAGYRSEARYVISDDAGSSHGTGIVTTLAVAATFANGVLSGFTWDDVGCNACGGQLNSRCVLNGAATQPQHSCAQTLDTCTAGQNCTLALYMGYSGSDRYKQTFQTAAQIHQINKYSATTLYNNLRTGIAGILQGSGETLLGSSSTATITSGSPA